MKVIIDTNLLIYSAERRIDLFEAVKERFGSVEILIPNLVLDELKDLKENAKKGSDKSAAKLVMDILKTKKFKILKLKGENADNSILEYSKNKDVVIITLDYRFQNKLKKENIKYSFLNSKKKLN